MGNHKETVKVLHIQAWMPESSATDGNNMITNHNIFSTRFHIPVTGFQHPCWKDGVFSNMVATTEYFHSI